MRLRPAAALVLLLTFPASTLAQTVPAASDANRPPAAEPTSRLNLKSLASHPLDVSPERPKDKLFEIRMPANRLHAFERAAPRQSCADSEARGRTDADARSMNKGAFFGSLAAGTFFPVWGIGGATAITATVKPKPKTVPPGVDAACYTQGYGNKARHDNVLAALWGSMAGTVIGLIFYGAVINE
jgi:hypothetical protein